MSSSKFIASMIIVLFVSLISTRIAQAGGLGELLGGGGGSGGELLGLIKVGGNISCSLDGSSSVVNGVATPSFPNALVQLQCGGNVVSSARTNADGVFSMILNPVFFLLESLSTCNIVVKTPLSTCNANLPEFGGLVSNSLQLLQKIISGAVTIINMGPDILKFVPVLN